jgi:hypothetical protein
LPDCFAGLFGSCGEGVAGRKRGSRLVTFKPDWKPAARVVDSDVGWAKVESEGACRACGKVLPTLRQGAHEIASLNRAHLVGKGVRGDDVPQNIIPLGGSGSTGCHGIQTSRNGGSNCHGVKTSYEQVVQAIRKTMRPEERQYIIAKKSRAWLEQTYPTQALAGGIYVDVDSPAELDSLNTMIGEARKDAGLPEHARVAEILGLVLHFFLTAPKERAA